MIRRATESDAGALTRLINAAFEVEKFFIESDRISLPQVREYFHTGAFLVAEDGGEMAACVYVEFRGERGYFGLLSVDPIRQRAGLGRRLIAEAEEFCRDAGCRFMDLRIVNLREELPAYYTKLGYSETGTSPFPPDAETKLPCHFIDMSKALA
ncbi:MAG: GNAT family N-acetyltransferase [Bryobacteraceae bacterium]|jgi:N-acetylglutamate synthase-like GNAT family acetyltransferase